MLRQARFNQCQVISMWQQRLTLFQYNFRHVGRIVNDRDRKKIAFPGWRYFASQRKFISVLLAIIEERSGVKCHFSLGPNDASWGKLMSYDVLDCLELHPILQGTKYIWGISRVPNLYCLAIFHKRIPNSVVDVLVNIYAFNRYAGLPSVDKSRMKQLPVYTETIRWRSNREMNLRTEQ